MKRVVIADSEATTIQNELIAHVEDDSMLWNDTHPSYAGIDGYDHRTVNYSAREDIDGLRTSMALRAPGRS